MKSTELKRWLTKQGATFENGKGSHLHVHLNGRFSVLPMHNKEIGTGLLQKIKKTSGSNRKGETMRYPAKLTPDGRFTMVTFPDIPEAATQGESREEALQHAADALETGIDIYMEVGKLIPEPSAPKRGQVMVELPTSVSLKIALHNAMLTQQVRPAELAKRLDMPRQNVRRLLDRKHGTPVDSLVKALQALGKRVEVTVS